jgi:hypothetical protein
MTKTSKSLGLSILAAMAFAAHAYAGSVPTCEGRLYPAKATAQSLTAIVADVDLGFGITYRGTFRLRDAVKDERSSGIEALRALNRKIEGRSLFFCVFPKDGHAVVVFATGESVNAFMIANGYMRTLIFGQQKF